MDGRLLIISSPSGGGKGTLIREVRERLGKLSYSVSYTTREIRTGESDGVDYHFVNRETFESLIERNEFLEYADVHGNYYGTSRSFIDAECEKGLDVILEIDVQGAEQVRRKVPDSIGVFILPPSFEVLKERLANRNTESGRELHLRLANSIKEVKCYSEFDYVIVNDELGEAVNDLAAVVTASRLERDRQAGVIRDILTTFDDYL